MRRPRTLVAAVVCGLLPACGGNSVTAPPPPPPPPAPVTTVIAEGSFNGLEPDAAVALALTTTRAGDLEFVVDWTFPTNDIGLLLFRGECSEEQFLAEQCDIADIADSTTAKPERVGIAGAPVGTYTLVVANLGDTEESFSYQVLLTTVGSASEGSARPSSVIPAARWRLSRGLAKRLAPLP